MKKFFTQIVKFYLVGGSGTLVNLCVVYFFTDFLKFWYLVSTFFGITISITTNFIGNKFWTFKTKLTKMKTIIEYVKYWVSSSVSIVIQFSLVYLLVEYFNLWYLFASVIAIVIASLSNFILSRYWAFK